jgi:hypothetical protein
VSEMAGLLSGKRCVFGEEAGWEGGGERVQNLVWCKLHIWLDFGLCCCGHFAGDFGRLKWVFLLLIMRAESLSMSSRGPVILCVDAFQTEIDRGIMTEGCINMSRKTGFWFRFRFRGLIYHDDGPNSPCRKGQTSLVRQGGELFVPEYPRSNLDSTFQPKNVLNFNPAILWLMHLSPLSESNGM